MASHSPGSLVWIGKPDFPLNPMPVPDNRLPKRGGYFLFIKIILDKASNNIALIHLNIFLENFYTINLIFL
jgi:hypothetical protein